MSNDDCVFGGSPNRGCVEGRAQLFATLKTTDVGIGEQEEVIVCDDVFLDRYTQYNSETGVFDLNKHNIDVKTHLFIDINATFEQYQAYPWKDGDQVIITLRSLQDNSELFSFAHSPEQLYVWDNRTPPPTSTRFIRNSNNFRGCCFFEMNGWDGFYITMKMITLVGAEITDKKLSYCSLTVLDLSEEAT